VSRAHGTAPDKGSPKLSPPVATVSESSPRLGKLGEGNDAKLTRGFRGRCGNGGWPAAEKQIGSGFFSRTRSSEPREPMRNAAKDCWEGWVVCGSLYRVVGGKVRGRRQPAVVGFELIGFNIDSGRGVDGAPS
jgi:hypothetical protein